MLNNKRKYYNDEDCCKKKCKLDKKRKASFEIATVIKKFKVCIKNYILKDVNFMILYGLL